MLHDSKTFGNSIANCSTCGLGTAKLVRTYLSTYLLVVYEAALIKSSFQHFTRDTLRRLSGPRYVDNEHICVRGVHWEKHAVNFSYSVFYDDLICFDSLDIFRKPLVFCLKCCNACDLTDNR